MVTVMDVSICMCSLRLIAIGNIQDITEIVITMLHLNDITVAMDGRTIDIEEISEEWGVEEEVVVVTVEGADKN